MWNGVDIKVILRVVSRKPKPPALAGGVFTGF